MNQIYEWFGEVWNNYDRLQVDFLWKIIKIHESGGSSHLNYRSDSEPNEKTF